MNSSALEPSLPRPVLRIRRPRSSGSALDPRAWLPPSTPPGVGAPGEGFPASGARRARPRATSVPAPLALRLVLVLLAVLLCLPGWTLQGGAAEPKPTRVALAFDASLPMLASALKLDEERYQQRHAVLDAAGLVAGGEAVIALSQPRHGVVQLTATREAQASVQELEPMVMRQLPGVEVQLQWVEPVTDLAEGLPFAILAGLVALCLLPGTRLGQPLARGDLAVRLATRGLGGLALSLTLLLAALAREGAGLGFTPWALTALTCLLLSFALAAVGQGLDRVVQGSPLRWALWVLALIAALSASAAAQMGWEPPAALVSPATAATDLLRGLLGGHGFLHPPALTIGLLTVMLAASPLLHPAELQRRRPRRSDP